MISLKASINEDVLQWSLEKVYLFQELGILQNSVASISRIFDLKNDELIEECNCMDAASWPVPKNHHNLNGSWYNADFEFRIDREVQHIST